jgi:phenylacetate-coenzyme A ligase PaaK-like adenylate-forming protein
MSTSSPAHDHVEQLQARVSALLAQHLAIQAPRVGWNAGQVRRHQRDRLQALLRHAIANSPFHARRLAGVDAERFEPGELPTLPVMTKAEMMAGFDEVVTESRITRRLVEEHLGSCGDVPSLLFDEYVCLASGGSSGLRGLFVQTLDEFTQFVASVVRGAIAAIHASGGRLPPDGLEIGLVGASAPVHSSGFGAATVTGMPVRFVSAPATLPLPEIVHRLNGARPAVLQGYPSLLRQLGEERRAGRLRINPVAVTTMGETLTTQDRAAITDGFGVPVTDVFVSTEGLVGRSKPGDPALTFASDMCITELVDEANEPVEPGRLSTKVLLTNLHNLTQPLIRYELTDQFTAEPVTRRTGHLCATVAGRTDRPFRYGTIEVPAFAIRSALAATPPLREYQIRQTADGLEAAIVAPEDLDPRPLADQLKATLRGFGIADPQISIRRVTSISRNPDTGKVQRFIPVAT